MTNSLHPIKPGDPLRASTINKLIEGTKAAFKTQKSGLPGNLPGFDASNTVIRTLVGVNVPLPRYAVVAIDAAMFDPNGNRESFLQEPAVRVSQPNAETQNFAILQRPASPNQIVPACVSGVSIVELSVQSPEHQYAVPNAGYTMTTAESGGAKILWKQDSAGGDGKIWGLVLFPVSAAPGTTAPPVSRDFCQILTPVRYTTDCERNPADGVIRRGIQFNDCFRVGTTEDYYRYEFNGWKLYEGSYTEDHLRRFLPVYAIITPDMTGEGSAQVADGSLQTADGSGGDCACKKPVYTIRGNNIQRCGNWFIASEGGRNSSGYYMIFNREYGGLYREGVGRVSVSCVACWSVLQTFHHDGSSTIEIFGEGGGTGAIWSTTIPAAGSWRISNIGAHSRRDQMGDTHWYMYIRRGNNVTVLCCSGVVISVNTPHNYGQNADHVWANVHRQRFAGLYEAPGRVHVIEGCNVVFTGCGALESAWGTANALVRTCKIVDIPKAGVAELSRTNAQGVQVWQGASNCLPEVYPDGSVNCDSRCGRGRDFTGAVTTTRIIRADNSTYLFIDLITGYTGTYLGRDANKTNNPELQGSMGTIAKVFWGEYPDCLKETADAWAEENLRVDATAVPTTNGTFTSEISQAVDRNAEGQTQTVRGKIYFNHEYVCTKSTGNRSFVPVPEIHLYLQNTVTGRMEFIDSFELPNQTLMKHYQVSPNSFNCGGGSGTGTVCGDHSCNRDGFAREYIENNFIRSCTTASFWNSVNPAVAALFEFGNGTGSHGSWHCTNYQNTGYICNSPTSPCQCGTNCDSPPSDCGGRLPPNQHCQSLCMVYNKFDWVFCGSHHRCLVIYKDGTIKIDDNGGHPTIPAHPYPSFVCEPPELDTSSICAFEQSKYRQLVVNGFPISGEGCMPAMRTSLPCTPSASCGKYTLGTGLFYDGTTVVEGGWTSPNFSIVSCCTESQEAMATTQGIDSGIFVRNTATGSNVTTRREVWAVFENIVAEQTYDNATHLSVSRIHQCRCGFIYAQMGTQNRTTGEVSYVVKPDWYDEKGIPAREVLGLQGEVSFSLTCCSGYGLASVSESRPVPRISVGTAPYYDKDRGIVWGDPSAPGYLPTTVELDDGTVATTRKDARDGWGYYTTQDCDGQNVQYWFYIDGWQFTGSDGVIRTFGNTWRGNPNTHVSQGGARHWIPYRLSELRTQNTVYRLIDGRFDGVVLRDSDITQMNCNFYNSKEGRFDGVDVRTSHNDPAFDFWQEYTWLPNEMPDCPGSPPLVKNTVIVTKSIPSIIQTDAPGYRRYRPHQQLNAGSKIPEKGQLSNITYQGAYQVLESAIYTRNEGYQADGNPVVINIVDEEGEIVETTDRIAGMEQLDRVPFQRTRNYSSKNRAQIINDRERIHNYDRIPFLSNNYGVRTSAFKDVLNPMLPQIIGYDGGENLPDQKRSVWSSAGVLFVLDAELGVIAVNQYGKELGDSS